MGYVCMGHTIFGTIMVDFSSLGYAVALIHRFISSRQVNESKKTHGKFWLREFFRLKGFNGALGFGAPLQVLVNSHWEVSEVRETSTEKTANFCFKFLTSEDLKIQLVEVPYPRTSALIFAGISTKFHKFQKLPNKHFWTTKTDFLCQFRAFPMRLPNKKRPRKTCAAGHYLLSDVSWHLS